MAVYLGFPISEELHARVLESVRRVREAPPEKGHTDFVTATIIGMTDAGIGFFFSEMVGRMRLGKAADRIAAVTLKTVKGGLHLIIHKVGKGLSNEQFHPLVEFLEETLVVDDDTCRYVAFPATPELAGRIGEYRRLVREAPPATRHALQCLDLIVDFKHESLEFFFRQSTERLQVRGWAGGAVSMGIEIAHRASNEPLKRLVPALTEESLLDIADFFGSIMLEQRMAEPGGLQSGGRGR